MITKVHFYSYFKELTGCTETSVELTEDSTIEQLYVELIRRYPKLAAMNHSTLIAVGVEYQGRSYVLKPGEEVSLFPPVQGG
jgi:molybdopterin converting factor small subunit